jgi:fructose-1,6-bisphosphatase II
MIANALERPINDVTVVILDRERHAELIRECRAAGARIKLISDGDVDAAIATCIEGTGIHVSMGTGGAPEGVLAAAALKCLGGGFMGRLKPRNVHEGERAKAMGFGDLGVRFTGNQAKTHSILIHSSTGTVRFIESVHRLGAKPYRRRG